MALTIAKDGIQLSQNGDHRGAINKFKQALIHHGKPSAVLEGRIGLAYDSLGEFELAIVHFSNAIEVRDSSVARVNRAFSYADIGDCDKAIIDAFVALAVEPQLGVGYNTHVEANYIISDCYFWDEKYLFSAQHLEDAIAIAKEHGYSDAEIEFMERELEVIRSYLE